MFAEKNGFFSANMKFDCHLQAGVNNLYFFLSIRIRFHR